MRDTRTAVGSGNAVALLIAATALAAARASSAGARFDGNPCVTARLTGKALLAKVTPMIGPGTSTRLDSGHKNECDLFSDKTGREVRVYIWPKSQKASAVSEI